MSASRRTVDQSSSRRATRHQNASPYPKRKPAPPPPLAQHAEVKTTSAIATLFSYLNPFKNRAMPPPAQPARQITHESQEAEVDSSDEDAHDTELENGYESPYHEEEAVLPSSGRSSLSKRGEPMGRRPNTHIPFPLVSPRKVNDMGSPASRGNMPPPPPPSRYAQNQQSTPSQRFQFTPTQSPASPLKSFQDLLSERAKTGQGITSEEVLRLSSAAQEAPLLPTAAYLGRDFVPSPSKSFLAPPPPSDRSSPSSPQPFVFSAGGAASSSTSSSPYKAPRSRPVYLGPGQSSARSPRSNMVMRAQSVTDSLGNSSTGLSRHGTAKELGSEGKRRRVEGMIGPQSGLSSSQSLFGLNAAARETAAGSQLNGVVSDKGKEKELPPRLPSTFAANTNVDTANKRRTSLNGINTTTSFLKPPTNPTPSPAVPSPLRNVTQSIPSPSPPRRSRTSASFLDIIKDVDKELSSSSNSGAPGMDLDDIIINPYERSGPKPPIVLPKKKPAAKKPALPPRKAESPKYSLPSSAQAIADSLPKPRKAPTPPVDDDIVEETPVPSRNHTKDRKVAFSSTAKPLSKQSAKSGSSPFLPPNKTTGTAVQKGSGKYTIYDVDEDDDMDIQEVPTPPKAVSSSKPAINGFSSSAARHSPPPPIVIEMDDSEDDPSSGSTNKAGKPSLVIEPGEPRRLGRSPSLGPPGNLYSPTIPSPLRLVTVPEQEQMEQEEVVKLPKGKAATNGDTHMQPEPAKVQQASKPILEPRTNSAEAGGATKGDPKAVAKNVIVSSLPVFAFNVMVIEQPVQAGTASTEAQRIAFDKLPKFEFHTVATAKPAAFTWTLAQPSANVGEWTCSTCMLKNPASATTKCTICQADRPSQPKSSAPPSINAGEWTCSTCALKNPASATTKCTICEADRADLPNSSAAPAAFDWSASGFKPKVAAGAWTCSMCMCSNPATATEKCTVCEGPRT